MTPVLALVRLSYREVVDRASRECLIALMRELNGNVTEAAPRAGVERESLQPLLKRYGVRFRGLQAARLSVSGP